MIFNKTGGCLYHHDLLASKQRGDLQGLINLDTADKRITERQKLVFGLLWSLKSFSQMVSCDKEGQEFRNFSTSEFSLHLLEIPTGLKFILLTSPTTANPTPLSAKNIIPADYKNNIPVNMSQLSQGTSEQNSDRVL